MEIPGLGPVAEDSDLGWYVSAPVSIAALGGAALSIIVDGYDDDPHPEDFHAAIRAFLTLDRSVLEEAAPHVYAYYRHVTDVGSGDDWHVEIDGPAAVFDHVQFGDEAIVGRGSHDDRQVYVSMECECDWEPEHGLQLVFRDGREVTKVGPYDGHLTNASAFGDGRLRGVVYHRP